MFAALCIALIFLFTTSCSIPHVNSAQFPMVIGSESVRSTEWKVDLSTEWDVLGPFPIHAREQQFLSPAFPLNLSEPIDYAKSWPSSYSDGGFAKWSKTTALFDKDRNEQRLQIAFPEVRWKYLRAFEGWAALQHHAVLRTTFRVVQPAADSTSSSASKGHLQANPPSLLIDLRQGAYFTIIPSNPPLGYTPPEPRWYAGNIYDLPRSLPHIVPLPPSADGEYQMFVSGDYEIRLFGDPDVQGFESPTQSIRVSLTIDPASKSSKSFALRAPALDVVPDFVGGYSFGTAIGVGLRNAESLKKVIVRSVLVDGPLEAQNALDISLLEDRFELAPSQSRIVPLVITQTAPFFGKRLTLILSVEFISPLPAERAVSTLKVLLDIRQRAGGGVVIERGARESIRGTFFFQGSIPSAFGAIPPSGISSAPLATSSGQAYGTQDASGRPPIVALHGAGVDILSDVGDFWADSMPLNEENWIILPTGRTPWGLDWHGPSAQDVWASVRALSSILDSDSGPPNLRGWKKARAFPPDTKVLLIGHSNGGQGTWYMSSRWPDKVLAAVPAAAYIKSQAYVSLGMARSAHYIDPALRAILESSLTPDDNDLHVANLLSTPILAIHGGADENVPAWHSRELVSTLKTSATTLGVGSHVTLREVLGKGHWFDDVLSNTEVIDFLRWHGGPSNAAATHDLGPGAANVDHPPREAKRFSLTVSSVTESGSLYGLRITGLRIAGRLGKLIVAREQDGLWSIETSNVRAFSISRQSILVAKEMEVDGERVAVSTTADLVHLQYSDDDGWKTVDRPGLPEVRSRMQAILASTAPLEIYYTTVEDLSLATRLAHDLMLYHRLDCRIVSAAGNGLPGPSQGNAIIIGQPASTLVSQTLEKGQTPFGIKDEQVLFNDRLLKQADRGFMLLHPRSGGGTILLMVYTSLAALERMGRLFPIRTGVAVPSWVIVGPLVDQLGAAGIEGAGIWGGGEGGTAAASWFR